VPFLAVFAFLRNPGRVFVRLIALCLCGAGRVLMEQAKWRQRAPMLRFLGLLGKLCTVYENLRLSVLPAADPLFTIGASRCNVWAAPGFGVDCKL
jgi:hypothetical protein